MLDKLKNLFNVKKLLEGVLVGRVLVRGVKVATAAILGLMAGPKVAPAIEGLRPLLDQMGTSPEVVATVGIAAIFAALEKYLKQRLAA